MRHEFVSDAPARMINGDGRPVDLRKVDALLTTARRAGVQSLTDQYADRPGHKPTQRGR